VMAFLGGLQRLGPLDLSGEELVSGTRRSLPDRAPDKHTASSSSVQFAQPSRSPSPCQPRDLRLRQRRQMFENVPLLRIDFLGDGKTIHPSCIG